MRLLWDDQTEGEAVWARSREFNADRVAGLSGDPRGLASELLYLERRARTWWELMFGCRAAPAQARLTDSHPPVRERVALLLALAGGRTPVPVGARTIPVRVRTAAVRGH